jgi:hypothetical protein
MAFDAPTKRAVLIGGAVAIMAAAVTGWFAFTSMSGTDRALASMRELPLVGLVMSDVPGVEARLRAAIEEEQRNPTRQGPARPFVVIGELRRTFIGPALGAADDASVVAVMGARAELVRHLQQVDLAACREFSGTGIQRVDKLDSEGKRLFRDVLSAMEAAYRSGRAAGSQPRPVANEQDFDAMLVETGFTPSDFQKLGAALTLPDADLCAFELRIDSAPAKLAESKRGPFARYVLTH